MISRGPKINKSYFLLLALSFLFAMGKATAQYGYYYENGESETSQHLRNQRGSMYVTQMTHFNLDFVSNRIHAFLVNSINKVPMGEMQQKKSGKYTVFSRRYKSEFSDEINTDFKITTEYKTALVGGEYVIVSAKIFGYESYVGNFLEEFWKPTMNASDKESGEVMKFNFMDDKVSVNLFTDKDSYISMASLIITNTSTATFSEYEKKLETYLSDFKQKRAAKTYQLANEDEAIFAKNKKNILSLVKRHLLTMRDNQEYKGTLDIQVNIDTSGEKVISVPSDFPGSIALNETLNSTYIEGLEIRDYAMRTSDKYSFEINFYSEKGALFAKNPESIKFSEGTDRFKEKVEKEFTTVNKGRGNYDIHAQELKIDNTDMASGLNIENFKKKIGPLGYAIGGAVIVAGVLYYFVL